MDGQSVNDRINLLISELNDTPSRFAKHVGIDASNMYKKLKGTVKFTDSDLNKMVNTTSVNRDWLLTGKGEMFTDRAASPTKEVEGIRYFPDVQASLGDKLLGEADERAALYFTPLYSRILTMGNSL